MIGYVAWSPDMGRDIKIPHKPEITCYMLDMLDVFFKNAVYPHDYTV